MLYEIFAPETETDFHYERPGKWDGRAMHVLNYTCAAAAIALQH